MDGVERDRFGKPKSADPNFRADCFGKVRRICDFPKTPVVWRPEETRCSHYAKRQLPDGRWACATHDPDKPGGLQCEQPVAWDERGKPGELCKVRARWAVLEDGAWRWYCTMHDPERPRCENAAAHPPGRWVKALVASGQLVEIKGGPKVCPRAPTAARRLFGVRLCAACCKPGAVRSVTAISTPSIERPPPCVLCGGTCALEDDRGRPFPCLCTPGGRELANGAPDRVVLDRLRAEGFLEELTPAERKLREMQREITTWR